MRRFNWVGCVILAAGLGGCSLYPIPDDVSPFRTEEVVRYGRCEVQDAIRRHLIDKKITIGNQTIIDQTSPSDLRFLIDATKKKKKTAPASLTPHEEHLLRLTKVAIVYSYDFNITENNKSSAGAGFRFPWSTGVLDVGGSAGLDLTRVGSRVFGTEDDWDDLMTNPLLCAKWPGARPGNILYPLTGSLGYDPLTGSIGVGRAVETFIDIDDQGGAKDNFVDTLTFTTSVGGDASAAVKLDPVPNQFRLVSASAAIGASRLDVHKLTISLAFPQPDPIPAITGVVRTPGDLNAPPFLRSPTWRARYNLCVQDARTRESSFKQLRLTDPLVYCITYADAFRFADQKVAVTVSRAVRVPAAPGAAESAAPRTRIEQRRILVPIPGGRPNYLPPSIQ